MKLNTDFINECRDLSQADLLYNLDMHYRGYNAYESIFIALVGIAEGIGVHRSTGYKSMVDYLSQHFERSTSWGYKVVRIGRFLVDHQYALRSFLDERITKAHVLEMTYYPHVSEQGMVYLAESATAADFRIEMSERFERVVQRKNKPRYFCRSDFSETTGDYSLRMRLPAHLGFLFENAIKEHEMMCGEAQDRYKILDFATKDITQALLNEPSENPEDSFRRALDRDSDRKIAEAEEEELAAKSWENSRWSTFIEERDDDMPQVPAADARVADREDLEKIVSGQGRSMSWLVKNLDSAARYVKEDRVMRRQANLRATKVSRNGRPSEHNMVGAMVHMACCSLTGTLGDSENPAAQRVPYPKTTMLLTAFDAVADPGIRLPADSKVAVLANSIKQTMELDENGQVVNYGRRIRCANDVQKEALFALYNHQCAMPLCRNRSFLQIHHIKDWALGGLTDIANLIPLCVYCHAAVTEGRMTITADDEVPGLLTFHLNDKKAYVCTNRLSLRLRVDKGAPDAPHNFTDGVNLSTRDLPQAAWAPGRGLGLSKMSVDAGLFVPANLTLREEMKGLAEQVRRHLGNPEVIPVDPGIVRFDKDRELLPDFARRLRTVVVEGDDDLGEVGHVGVVVDDNGCFLFAMDTAELLPTIAKNPDWEYDPRAVLLHSQILRLRDRVKVRDVLRGHANSKPSLMLDKVAEPDYSALIYAAAVTKYPSDNETLHTLLQWFTENDAMDLRVQQEIYHFVTPEYDPKNLVTMLRRRGDGMFNTEISTLVQGLMAAEKLAENNPDEPVLGDLGSDLFTQESFENGLWMTVCGYANLDPDRVPNSLYPETGDPADVSEVGAEDSEEEKQRRDSVAEFLDILENSDKIRPLMRGFVRDVRHYDAGVGDDATVKVVNGIDGLIKQGIALRNSDRLPILRQRHPDNERACVGWKSSPAKPRQFIVPSLQNFPSLVARSVGVPPRANLLMLRIALLCEIAVAYGVSRARLADILSIDFHFDMSKDSYRRAERQIRYEIGRAKDRSGLSVETKAFYADAVERIMELTNRPHFDEYFLAG